MQARGSIESIESSNEFYPYNNYPTTIGSIKSTIYASLKNNNI